MITTPLHPGHHAAGEQLKTAAPSRPGLLRRALAAVEDAVAALLYWQAVSETIDRLLRADDAQLKAMGLKRNQIVARAFENARERRPRG